MHLFVSHLIVLSELVCHLEALFAVGIFSVEIHLSLSRHYHCNASSALMLITKNVSFGLISDKLLDFVWSGVIDLSLLAGGLEIFTAILIVGKRCGKVLYISLSSV